MINLLFISSVHNILTGGSVVSKTVINSLMRCPQVSFFKKEFSYPVSLKQKIFTYIKGGRYSINPVEQEDLENFIVKNKINVIWFNCSCVGSLPNIIKKKFPKIKIISFAHNCETYLALQLLFLYHFLSLHTWCSLGSIVFCERKQVLISDKLICLCKRDSDHFNKIFGKSADLLLPLALDDYFEDCPQNDLYCNFTNNSYGLFVGSAFPPNIFGIHWFCKKVAPFLHCKIKIIGSGLEKIKWNLKKSPNVEILGRVENIADYMKEAAFVISPIFHGSGMKTKTAEALMYGKFLFGTPESFVGYEDVIGKNAILCRNSHDFISMINDFTKTKTYKSFIRDSRDVFEKQYSQRALAIKIHKFFQSHPFDN